MTMTVTTASKRAPLPFVFNLPVSYDIDKWFVGCGWTAAFANHYTYLRL